MQKLNLKTLKKEAKKRIEEVKDLKNLNRLYHIYSSKDKGKISQIFSELKNFPKEKRAKIGKEANELKNFLEIKFIQRTKELKEKAKIETEKKEWIDITIPGKMPYFGHLHPLTLIKRKIEEIFQSMGFSIVEGPEIETEWYNFDALNIPKEHPARDMWDTFWLKSKARLLLRTHTTTVDVRYMKKNNPPLRIIIPGRIFRHEATDPGHEINFYQVDGLMVGKDVTVANFKAIILEFFKKFFKKPINIRLRPSYFPFTEPSFEVDISCLICNGKGCSTCKKTGWIETLGAGMIHQSVLKSAGLNPKDWQGFAFGMGIDRLTMMKYKINDIRFFYSGDLRFLKQF